MGFDRIAPLIRRTLRLTPTANLEGYANLIRSLERALETARDILDETKARLLQRMQTEKVCTLEVQDGRYVVVAPHDRTKVDLSSLNGSEIKLDIQQVGSILRFYPSKTLRQQRRDNNRLKELENGWECD